MTGLLLAFMIVTLVPLFVATWRTSLLGLLLQSVLIAWVALRHQTTSTFDSLVLLFDVVVVRAVLAPLLLYRTMQAQNAPPRHDVIAPNLFSWAIVVALVVVAFRTADALVPVDGDAQMLVAASSSAFVLGLFVLATARGTFSQIIGVLRIENAIALFELGAPGEHDAPALRVAMTAVLLVSVLYYRWYLVQLPGEREQREPDPRVSSVAL